jgi:hypothetical protein
MRESVELLKSQNPEFTHYLFDDADCREFIAANFDYSVLDAFDRLIPGAYKADLWRYCVLYVRGGIYLDIKYHCVNLKVIIYFLVEHMPVCDLNARAKACRGYERDRVFLKCLLGTGIREFDALVLELGDRTTLWVPAWQQRIKVVKAEGVEVGKAVRFRCAMNVGQRRWKDRMVIELV